MPGSMTPEEIRALADLPLEEQSRSRLEPYKNLILRWRRQGRTYRRIRQLLAEKCGVNVATMTLHEFVKLRSRPRKPVDPEIDPESAASQPVEAMSQAATSGKRLSAEERAAQVEFIRSLNKPASNEQPNKAGWNFDTDKPRTDNKP